MDNTWWLIGNHKRRLGQCIAFYLKINIIIFNVRRRHASRWLARPDTSHTDKYFPTNVDNIILSNLTYELSVKRSFRKRAPCWTSLTNGEMRPLTRGHHRRRGTSVHFPGISPRKKSNLAVYLAPLHLYVLDVPSRHKSSVDQKQCHRRICDRPQCPVPITSLRSPCSWGSAHTESEGGSASSHTGRMLKRCCRK